MENNEHIHAIMWVAQRSGLYYVPINIHLTAPEAAYIIGNSGAKAIIGSAAPRKTCENLAQRLPNGLPALRMIAGPDLNDDFSGWLRYPECVADFGSRRSTINARAICCSIRRAPPVGRRGSSANCRTSRRPRRPA